MWGDDQQRPEPENCDVCDDPIVGEVGGRGLLVFPRGDDVEYQEPALCDRCAHAIGATALFRLYAEEEDG